MFFLNNTNNIYAQQNYFEQTNGPFAPGQVMSLGLGNNQNIWAGIRFAGLYYSQDSSMSFYYVPAPFTHPSSIQINKSGYIYVGNNIHDDYGGVYRSTNNGLSWINVLPSKQVTCLELDSASNIVAGTRNQGLFRSTNDGATWDKIWMPSMHGGLYALSLNLQGHIFISIDSLSITSFENNYKVLRSTNNGTTWDTLFRSTSDIFTNFAFEPSGYIVGTFRSTNSDSSGFFISTNHGISWSRRNIIREYFNTTGFRLIFNEPLNCFIAALSISNGTYIIKSQDNGNSWNTIAQVDNKYSDVVQIISNNNGIIFVGNNEGLKHSTDGGFTWGRDDNGFFAVESKQLTLIPEGRISVKTNSGNYRYDINNFIWSKDSIKAGSFLISDSGNYFLADGEVHKSIDGGVNWITKLTPICMNYGSRITEITKLSNGFIFCCGGQWCGVHNTEMALIFRSINEGENWEVIHGATPYGPFNTITTTENDIMLVGGNGLSIHRSTDYGITWAPCTNGLPPGLDVTVIRSKIGGIIFAGTTTSGLFKSLDLGSTWFPANSGLTSLNIRSVVINNTGIVFLGTATGVFKSTDDGENWFSLNDGLLDISILSLLCDSLGYLYVATTAAGVFRSTESTTHVKNLRSDLPLSDILFSNYPNPFNSTTTFEFYIPERSITILKIMDNLGCEVNTVINDELRPGWYRYTWDASALPSGVYFSRLVTRNHTKTNKLILLR